MRIRFAIIPLLLIIFLYVNARAAAQFATGTLPLVDGVYNSTQTIITNRNPVFSWEFASAISSFTIVVSPNSNLSSPVWSYVGSTTTQNTINFITRISYNTDGAATALSADQTYYWQVTIYDADAGVSASSQFTAVSSLVTLPNAKLDLAVDWNNPFDPTNNQETRFRFVAKDRDRLVQVRVFTISGELVRQWSEQTALEDAWYTISWDGTNTDGNVVARGIYFVNMVDVGDGESVTKRVIVYKQ